MSHYFAEILLFVVAIIVICMSTILGVDRSENESHSFKPTFGDTNITNQDKSFDVVDPQDNEFGIQGIILYNSQGTHHCNIRGIQWLCIKLGLTLVSVERGYDLSQLRGQFLVLAFQDIIPNIYSNLYIICGPQFYPHDLPPEQTSRVVFNCLSQWVRRLFLQLNPTGYEFICAPIPIDYESIQPVPAAKTSVTLYLKNRYPTVFDACCNIVQQFCDTYQYSFIKIEYGKYQHEDYLSALQRSIFAVFCIGSESQGFCVQEAMALDIPMIMLDARDIKDSPNNITQYSTKYQTCMTAADGATLWDDSLCGLRLSHLEDLSETLEIMKKQYTHFHPRQLLLKELTPEKCLRTMLAPFQRVIVPMGIDCGIATELKNQQFRQVAYPFDWIVTYQGITDVIKNKFADFFQRNDISFPHDTFPKDQKKYERRIDRFTKLLSDVTGPHVCLVRKGHALHNHAEFSPIKCDIQEGEDLADYLRETYPSRKITIIILLLCEECYITGKDYSVHHSNIQIFNLVNEQITLKTIVQKIITDPQR